MLRAGLFALAILSVVTCTADTPESTGAAEQAVVAPPLPSNLNLILNAKTTVTVGAFTNVNGDVGSAGLSGSVLFDVSSSQGFGGFNVLANTVTVNTGASVGHVFGNDITVNGFASQQSLGLDPTTMPQVPAVTAATPGTTNVSTNENQAKQLCPGQYGAISLGVNSTLNLNGGVYQVTKLTLADGARLEPSEPVVILVSGGVTTGIGSAIRPSAQSLNPMTAANVRIEIGGAVTLGDSNQIRAHLLVNGKFTAGKSLSMTGAAWAKSVNVGTNGFLSGEGVFSTQAPSVPPPCNDNNACTVDTCVGGGTSVAFCRNAPVPAGTSCGDGNACNGDERCDAGGQCQPGTIPPAGTACADGDLCNGDETCDGFGTCLAGTPPVVNDGNTCTVDACDPVIGVSHISLPDGTACSGAGVCQAGTCSIQARTLVAITDAGGRLQRIDPDTRIVTDIGPLGVAYAFGDCAFDSADATLYMVDGRGARALYRVNIATGAATLVGVHGITDMFALGYHPPSNALFGAAGDGNLYRINTSTGAATLVGQTGRDDINGLVFDSKRNVMIGLTAGGTILFSIDVTTGAIHPLLSTSFINNLGLTYDPVIDRFWVDDFDGNLLQFDPNNGFARSTVATIGGPRTCIATVPQP